MNGRRSSIARANRQPHLTRRFVAVISVAASLGFVGACEHEVSPEERERVGRLTTELEQTRSDIEEAEAEGDALSGGLVEALVAVRLEILKTNEALIQQRIHAIEAGAPVTVAVSATKPDADRAAALAAEIQEQKRKVADARAEADRYGGGLIKALSLATVATAETTLAMLEQQRIVSKYGLAYPAVSPASTKETSAEGAAIQECAASSEAKQSAPIVPPGLDPAQCLRIQTVDSSVLSSNDVFTELAWKVDVESTCDNDYGIRVTFTTYDQDEFELESDREDVFVASHGVAKARGKMLVSPPEKARRMARHGASIELK